jgi:hypothetical protein
MRKVHRNVVVVGLLIIGKVLGTLPQAAETWNWRVVYHYVVTP